jgi:hypothetical protein
MAKKQKTRKRLSNITVEEVSLVDSPAIDEGFAVIRKRKPQDNPAESEENQPEPVVKSEDEDSEDSGKPQEIESVEKSEENSGQESSPDESGQEVEKYFEGESDEDFKMRCKKVKAVMKACVDEMRKVAGDMDANQLAYLAQSMEFVYYAFPSDEYLESESVQKTFENNPSLKRLVAASSWSEEEWVAAEAAISKAAEPADAPAEPVEKAEGESEPEAPVEKAETPAQDTQEPEPTPEPVQKSFDQSVAEEYQRIQVSKAAQQRANDESAVKAAIESFAETQSKTLEAIEALSGALRYASGRV